MKAHIDPARTYVGLSTFSRTSQLRACLNSVLNMENFIPGNLIVIHQTGYEENLEILREMIPKVSTIISVEGTALTPLQNINRNRIILYKFAFEILDAQTVLGVEDDVILGYDALNFSNEMIVRYHQVRSFRGVNLGSGVARTQGSTNSYSLLRYGLHGQASAMPHRTWRAIIRLRLLRRWMNLPFDGMIEGYLRSGFMVTANSSRYLDTGWSGTHANGNPNDTHYVNLGKSWVGIEPFDQGAYFFEQLDHSSWREDCVEFKKRANLSWGVKMLGGHLLR